MAEAVRIELAPDPVEPCPPRLRMCVPTGPESRDPVERVRRAVAVLRDPASVTDLESRVPLAVLELGFDRACYARVSGSAWEPVAWTPAAASAGGPVRLGDRARFPTGRTPFVVGPADAGRLLPVDWCPSYLVAAVRDRASVVGLVHAGHTGAVRPPTAQEREALWTLTDAVGPGLEAARAGDALRDLMARMSAVADELGHRPSCSRGSEPAAGASLTVREREVLDLMAAGQTNGQIARRLVITEGTAKSHVKRIMRKLDAANRAEAVAAWLRYSDRLVAERS